MEGLLWAGRGEKRDDSDSRLRAGRRVAGEIPNTVGVLDLGACCCWGKGEDGWTGAGGGASARGAKEEVLLLRAVLKEGTVL